VLTEGLAEHANVIFPAESYAEKEGTIVHPDGRLQRLRTAIAHPGEVRSSWSVIAELARRAGLDTEVLTSPMAFAQLVEAVPFYAGLTLEDIGGRGVRWPEREAASAMPAGDAGTGDGAAPEAATTRAPGGDEVRTPAGDVPARGSGPPANALRLGTYRSIWASPEVEISPGLQYTVAHQQVEVSPEDARRLGIGDGERIVVSQNGTRLSAPAHVRTGVPAGVVFLAEGIAGQSANSFTEPEVEVRPA
jgi:NADH-quinone oxidoreductase subunit G